MLMLDTNAIIYYLHRVEPYALQVKEVLVRRKDLAITLRILDEVLFTLIRLEAWRQLGIRKLGELRAYVRKHDLKKFSDAINDFERMVNELGILVLEDRGGFQEVLNTMRNYNLLPSDALIAVTAKHYGIDTILTFDEDFKRIPWLKVIP